MRTQTSRASAWAGVLALVMFAAVGSAAAQDLSVKGGATPAPSEVAAPLHALLDEQAAAVVTRGDNTIEFWWVKSVALDPASTGAPAWAGLPAGAFVGAIRIAKPLTDIRGFTMQPGVYTLRYALQPQDGDHTGVSPYREFLLVAPTADDTTPDPVGYKGAVALAKKTLGRSHPAALSLDPPASTANAGSVITNDAGHKAVVFEVPATRGGTPAGSLKFGLILVGTIAHQM